MFPKILGFHPKSSIWKRGGFPWKKNHPFWGKQPYFGKHPNGKIWVGIFGVHPWNLTWNLKEVPRKGSFSWKPSFAGSMLNFGGVSFFWAQTTNTLTPRPSGRCDQWKTWIFFWRMIWGCDTTCSYIGIIYFISHYYRGSSSTNQYRGMTYSQLKRTNVPWKSMVVGRYISY